MKKSIVTIIILFMAALTAYMIYNSITRLNATKQGEKNASLMTSIVAKLTPLEGRALKSYLRPTLLIYFNSECDYCQHQLELINGTPEILEQFQLILVSYQDILEIETHLVNYSAITVANYALYQVEPDKVLSTFGRTSVPQLFVYQDNLLKGTFKGFTKTESILETIRL